MSAPVPLPPPWPSELEALLGQAPELAALWTLEAALRASQAALHAVHSELREEDFALAPHSPSAQACLADALLNHMEGLQVALKRYCSLVLMQDYWAGVKMRHEPPSD